MKTGMQIVDKALQKDVEKKPSQAEKSKNILQIYILILALVWSNLELGSEGTTPHDNSKGKTLIDSQPH